MLKATLARAFIEGESLLKGKLSHLPHAAIAKILTVAIEKIHITDPVIRDELLARVEEFKQNRHMCIKCLLCQLSLLIALSESDAALEALIMKLSALIADGVIVASEGLLEGSLELVEVIADALIAASGTLDFGLSELLLPEAVVVEEGADVAVGAAGAVVELKAKKIVLQVLKVVISKIRGKVEKEFVAHQLALTLCRVVKCCSANHFYKGVKRAHVLGKSLIPMERGPGIRGLGLDPAKRNAAGGATAVAAAQSGRVMSEADQSAVGQCLTGNEEYARDYAEDDTSVLLRISLYEDDLHMLRKDAAGLERFTDMNEALAAKECTAIEVIPPDNIEYEVHGGGGWRSITQFTDAEMHVSADSDDSSDDEEF